MEADDDEFGADRDDALSGEVLVRLADALGMPRGRERCDPELADEEGA